MNANICIYVHISYTFIKEGTRAHSHIHTDADAPSRHSLMLVPSLAVTKPFFYVTLSTESA